MAARLVQSVAVPRLVDVEHRLDDGIEPDDVEGLVDRALGLPQSEWVLGRDLIGGGARLHA